MPLSTRRATGCGSSSGPVMRMHRRRRPELFPADRRLQLRMLLAIVLTPAVALGGIVAVVLVGSTRVTGSLLVALALAAVALRRSEDEVPPSIATVEDWPALHAVVERLCVVADLPKPAIVVELDDRPNSWTVCGMDGSARLHLTTGLLLLLPQQELEAVIAHELSHLAHHDALVLSLVGGLSRLLLVGAERASRDGWAWFLWPGMLVAYALGTVSRLGALSLSRAREFAADSGSAALTGRPAALACALRRIRGDLARLPARDLRAASATDMLGLLPVAADTEPWRLTATHPDVHERIARLDRIEEALQAARQRSPRTS
jgi:heat shock protein HtpX